MKNKSEDVKQSLSKYVLILALIIMHPLCYALGVNKNAGELYTRIMEKLEFEPNIDASNIAVAVKDNGIVVLSGKVGSYTEKRLAKEAVEKVENVKGVANELDVELLFHYVRNDVDILNAALSSLKWNVFVPHERIKVVVDNGHLTLSGDVKFYYQKQNAENSVRDLYGVKSVINNIRVKPTVSPLEVKERIVKEFERNARIDAKNIQVEVDGSTVTLKGSVKNFDEDKEARNAAWSIPGVSVVVDKLKINW